MAALEDVGVSVADEAAQWCAFMSFCLVKKNQNHVDTETLSGSSHQKNLLRLNYFAVLTSLHIISYFVAKYPFFSQGLLYVL